MPECSTALFQLALYLAKAPKSNLAYQIDQLTAKDVHTYGNLPVPMVIRNASSSLMKEQGYGKGYVYAHDVAPGQALNQHFPDALQ